MKALWFSLVASLLLLAPTVYMLEVYDRVVNSRSHMTLWMLTILVLGGYVVMQVLDWARNVVMAGSGQKQLVGNGGQRHRDQGLHLSDLVGLDQAVVLVLPQDALVEVADKRRAAAKHLLLTGERLEARFHE